LTIISTLAFVPICPTVLTTQIKEDYRIEFRFEGFNFFNHPNFPTLAGNPENGNFARANSTTPARVLQFGLKLYF